jgi:hypothetical protein
MGRGGRDFNKLDDVHACKDFFVCGSHSYFIQIKVIFRTSTTFIRQMPHTYLAVKTLLYVEPNVKISNTKIFNKICHMASSKDQDMTIEFIHMSNANTLNHISSLSHEMLLKYYIA